MRGIFLALHSEKAIGRSFNLCSGIPRQLGDVIEVIFEAAGGGRISSKQYPQNRLENACQWGSNFLAKELIDWTPTKSLADGMQETVSWYRNFEFPSDLGN